MSWEIDEPTTVACAWCNDEHDREQYEAEGCPDRDLIDGWDDGGDDQEECTGCGDYAGYLSSDGLCDGCVVHGVPQPVVTLQPQPGFL